MQQKNKKQMVYFGPVCKVENRAGIFLSYVYVIKSGNYYINYFNKEERFSTNYKKEGDQFITIDGFYKMNEEEVFKHMLYNPHYCKDRVAQIKKLFASEKFTITNGEFEKCREVIQQDSMCYDICDSCDGVTRYYVKQKIK